MRYQLIQGLRDAIHQEVHTQHTHQKNSEHQRLLTNNSRANGSSDHVFVETDVDIAGNPDQDGRRDIDEIPQAVDLHVLNGRRVFTAVDLLEFRGDLRHEGVRDNGALRVDDENVRDPLDFQKLVDG